jgi:toxin ParE1/3/4
MKIRYHPDAFADLDSIRRYIARDNSDAAWVVGSFIRRAINGLQEWPHSGRATEKENLRRLVVTNYPYVVYYRVGTEVVILSVMHSAQDR